jgi:glycosyltransferase involved in cell wall biosynthesis
VRPLPDRFDEVVRQRLVAVHEVLSADPTLRVATATLAELVEDVASAARTRADSDSAWLLFTALAGRYPNPDEVVDLRRRLDLSSSGSEAGSQLLDATRVAAAGSGVWNRPIRIVQGAMVVDVNFCAKNEHNTGIQRLVRETVTRWDTLGRDMILVAWDHEEITRALHPREHDRVVNWASTTRSHDEREEGENVELIIPVRSTVLITEVPRLGNLTQLAALAEHSGNRVCLIGYDAIPLVSADMVPPDESERFAHYLTFVKHSSHVFAISAAAAGEFLGFASAVRAQGLEGPRVTELSLPVDLPETWEIRSATATDIPLAISVGSHEPRKNQDAILDAAETLWREGLIFQLVFIGRGDLSFTGPFDRKLEKLRKQGHRVESRRTTTDQELAMFYHSATVTLFPSLHEGYGLPVAESLAAGTPVITSNFGSTAEIGADGGCLLVDPRDDADLTNAMRRILTEPDLVAELRAQIALRTHRTWADYSDGLWSGLTAGDRA